MTAVEDPWTTADEWFAFFLHHCQIARRRSRIVAEERFIVSPEVVRWREYDEKTETDLRFMRGQRAVDEINERKAS